MQNYSKPAGRSPMKTEGINSKVSAPAGAMGKGMGNMPESPVSAGSAKSPVKGFSGGVINPKI